MGRAVNNATRVMSKVDGEPSRFSTTIDVYSDSIAAQGGIVADLIAAEGWEL